MSTKSWKDLVKEADPDSAKKEEVIYKFPKNRKFTKKDVDTYR